VIKLFKFIFSYEYLRFFIIAVFLWFNWEVFSRQFEDFWENLLIFLGIFFWFSMLIEWFEHFGYVYFI